MLPVLSYEVDGETCRFRNGVYAAGTVVQLRVLPGSLERWAFDDPVEQFGVPLVMIGLGAAVGVVLRVRNQRVLEARARQSKRPSAGVEDHDEDEDEER